MRLIALQIAPITETLCNGNVLEPSVQSVCGVPMHNALRSA